MKQSLKELIDNNMEFQSIIEDLVSNATVQEMRKYRQHCNTSCFEHCYVAAYYCYYICKNYKLDYISATRAAMLHDLFLYDWRVKQPNRKGFHAFTHGKTACDNSCKLFELNQKEKDIIIKHMWPVTISFPQSIEGFILTFVDKYCALSETFDVIMYKIFRKRISRYAYIILSLLIIKL